MNISISYLISNNLKNSPLIYSPDSFKSTKFYILNSKIKNSFSSFYNSNNQLLNKNLFFKNNYFNNFLSSVIKVQQNTFENQIIREQISEAEAELHITNCIFENMRTTETGSAINIKMDDCVTTIKDSFFENCVSDKKGGAIYIKCSSIVFSRDCFHYCRCGFENGCDGSTIYAQCNKIIKSDLITCHECPKYGEKCWYGICNLWNGAQISTNINISKSEVDYVCGLAHCCPSSRNSSIRFYTSVRGKNGNSLSFIALRFFGDHKYGNIVNNSCKMSSGLIYFQDSETSLSNFVFVNNKGPLTYACVGVSYGHFFKCEFDQIINTGIGFNSTHRCFVLVNGLATLEFSALNTRLCAVLPNPNDARPNLWSYMLYIEVAFAVFLGFVLLFTQMYSKKFKKCFRIRRSKKAILPALVD